MSHGYLKWPGLTSSNTLIISVDKQAFGIKPEPIEYSSKVFKPKQEAHITVIGSEFGTHLLEQFIDNPEIKHQLRLAFESTDWSYALTDELRLLTREDTDQTGRKMTQQTLIMLVKMPGMAVFYTKLKTLGLVNLEQPVPPPHVTLYTRNCDQGIGVRSDRELSELTSELVKSPV